MQLHAITCIIPDTIKQVMNNPLIPWQTEMVENVYVWNVYSYPDIIAVRVQALFNVA